MDARVDGLAHFLVAQGLGCHTERADLAGHESGQDHVGIYLRNGNEYLETMLAGYRSRVAPFNVNYRYVDRRAALPARRRRRPRAGLPRGVRPAGRRDPRPAAAPRGARPGRRRVRQRPAARRRRLRGGAAHPAARGRACRRRRGDDLYIVYTGGTTGMPKGVLWRQHDIYVSSMGGTPFGTTEPFASYDAIAAHAAVRRRPDEPADDPAVHARRRPVVDVPHDHRRRPDRDPRRRAPLRRRRRAARRGAPSGA